MIPEFQGRHRSDLTKAGSHQSPLHLICGTCKVSRAGFHPLFAGKQPEGKEAFMTKTKKLDRETRLACNTCRRRRIKCLSAGSSEPRCAYCLHLNIECIFSGSDRRRGTVASSVRQSDAPTNARAGSTRCDAAIGVDGDEHVVATGIDSCTAPGDAGTLSLLMTIPSEEREPSATVFAVANENWSLSQQSLDSGLASATATATAAAAAHALEILRWMPQANTPTVTSFCMPTVSVALPQDVNDSSCVMPSQRTVDTFVEL